MPSTYNPHSSCKTLYRSAIVTEDMAHTNASVERIQNAQNVINRNLGLRNLSKLDTQRADGANTKETGTKQAAVNWL